MSFDFESNNLGMFEEDRFELPEAMLTGEQGEAFAFEINDGKLSLLTYRKIEDAEVALEIGRHNGPIDDTVSTRTVRPDEWGEIAHAIGPSLSEVMVIIGLNGDGMMFVRVPIIDFLRIANETNR